MRRPHTLDLRKRSKGREGGEERLGGRESRGQMREKMQGGVNGGAGVSRNDRKAWWTREQGAEVRASGGVRS